MGNNAGHHLVGERVRLSPPGRPAPPRQCQRRPTTGFSSRRCSPWAPTSMRPTDNAPRPSRHRFRALRRAASHHPAPSSLARRDKLAAEPPCCRAAQDRHQPHDLRRHRAGDCRRSRHDNLDRPGRRGSSLRAAQAEFRGGAARRGSVRDHRTRPRALGPGAARPGQQPQGVRGRARLRHGLHRHHAARGPHQSESGPRRHSRRRQSSHSHRSAECDHHRPQHPDRP